MGSNLKNKKHLFFDLDDTLWDFEKNSSQVLEKLFFEFDLDKKLKTNFINFYFTYKETNSLLWQQYGKKEIDKSYLRNHRFNLTFKKFNYDNYNENLRVTEEYLNQSPKGKHLKESCIETLDYLDKHYKLHIITNGFKEVQSIKIDNCGLKNYFDTIIISEEHNLTKPDEKIFRLAENFAKTTKDECVMIGDNFESDIIGAINSGWDAIYFTEKNPENFSGKNISNLKELQTIF